MPGVAVIDRLNQGGCVVQVHQLIHGMERLPTLDVDHGCHLAHVEILTNIQSLLVLDEGKAIAAVPVVGVVNRAAGQVDEFPAKVGRY